MQRSLWVVLLVACNSSAPTAIDAPRQIDASQSGPDANEVFCPVGASTANVSVTHGATTATYAQLHAGGTWFTGPFAPVAGPDMSASLLLTSSVDPLLRDNGWCCAGAGACCTLDGILVETDGLGIGSEVGPHAVRIRSFQDATLQLMGTLTITTFVQPFEHAPGRIAGSISASSGGTTVSGTYDNTFCAALLTQTI